MGDAVTNDDADDGSLQTDEEVVVLEEEEEAAAAAASGVTRVMILRRIGSSAQTGDRTNERAQGGSREEDEQKGLFPPLFSFFRPVSLSLSFFRRKGAFCARRRKGWKEEEPSSSSLSFLPLLFLFRMSSPPPSPTFSSLLGFLFLSPPFSLLPSSAALSASAHRRPRPPFRPSVATLGKFCRKEERQTGGEWRG